MRQQAANPAQALLNSQPADADYANRIRQQTASKGEVRGGAGRNSVNFDLVPFGEEIARRARGTPRIALRLGCLARPRCF